MSDDDDKRGSENNTGRDHKPKHARDHKNAPRGQIGTNSIAPSGPQLGLGGSSTKRDYSESHEHTRSQNRSPQELQEDADPTKRHTREIIFELDDGEDGTDPQKYIDPAKDDRPVFEETGDKETDEFYQKTHRMIPKDGEGRGVTKEGPRMSQSDFAKAFRQAHGQTQTMRQSKGIDPD